jgi:transcriptional regulator with XRE-family HTH domain
MMNQYLVILGTNIPEIRNVMNLTQEELANMMGVSRPTIVKLEQDPSKLSKALAYALFGSVTFEIKKRIKQVQSIDHSKYDSIEKLGIFVTDLKEATSISNQGLGKIATVGLSALIPGIGTLLAAGLKTGWDSLNNIDPKKAISKWDEKKAEKILEMIQKKISNDEKKLLECFNIPSLTIEMFGEEIEKGEEEDYDLW